jgi:hypothetical protein
MGNIFDTCMTGRETALVDDIPSQTCHMCRRKFYADIIIPYTCNSCRIMGGETGAYEWRQPKILDNYHDMVLKEKSHCSLC